MKIKVSKDFLFLCLVTGVCSTVCATIFYVQGVDAGILALSISVLVHTIMFAGILLALSVLISGVFFFVFRALDSTVLRTFLSLLGNKLSARIQSKNASTIYPCLQLFLFNVLAQNKQMLNLQLGQDATCLTPLGYRSSFRKGCIFYRFELISPEAPSMDCNTLCRVIQQFIWAELNSYGIAGLPSSYQDPKYGTTPSVYLDRLQYDEGQHLLQFDLLYIANPEASSYAWQCTTLRDKAKVQIEPEVYDDDL